MILQLLYSSSIIIGVFTASTITVYSVCNSKNISFINPKYNTPHLLLSHYNELTNILSPIIIASISICYYVTSQLDYKYHNTIVTFLNLVLYSLFVELFYYIYHRIMHTKLLYRNFHIKHHENIDIYPLDALYFDSNDLLLYVCCLHLPLMYINMDLLEYILGLYFYVTMGYFSHSSIIYNHHIIHHTQMKCNYCLVFPIYDIIFKTYRV